MSGNPSSWLGITRAPGDNSTWPATTAFTTNAISTALGTFKSAVVVGATAGAITVSGITATSLLVAVVGFVGAGTAVTDVAAETANFTVTGANQITGSTDTSAMKLLVVWHG